MLVFLNVLDKKKKKETQINQSTKHCFMPSCGDLCKGETRLMDIQMFGVIITSNNGCQWLFFFFYLLSRMWGNMAAVGQECSIPEEILNPVANFNQLANKFPVPSRISQTGSSRNLCHASKNRAQLDLGK